MDLKNVENQLDSADSLLDKTWKLLGKHWGKLLVLLLIYGCYKFIILVGDEMDKDVTDTENFEVMEDPHLLNEYFIVDPYGDTLIVSSWSDGTIDTLAH